MSASDATDDDRGCPKCGHTETDVGTISTTGAAIPSGGFLLWPILGVVHTP